MNFLRNSLVPDVHLNQGSIAKTGEHIEGSSFSILLKSLSILFADDLKGNSHVISNKLVSVFIELFQLHWSFQNLLFVLMNGIDWVSDVEPTVVSIETSIKVVLASLIHFDVPVFDTEFGLDSFLLQNTSDASFALVHVLEGGVDSIGSVLIEVL